METEFELRPAARYQNISPRGAHVIRCWGDYDNDGDLDILLAGIADGSSYVCRVNRTDGDRFNEAPAAPTSLTAEPGVGMATLSRTAPTDTATPTDGLSYNLRVGTARGGSDVVGPMSLDDGFRMVAQRGLVQGTNWTLTAPELFTTCKWCNAWRPIGVLRIMRHLPSAAGQRSDFRSSGRR